MLRYLLLAIIFSGFSCTNLHDLDQHYLSIGTIEIKGAYPHFNCTGFEREVIRYVHECEKRSDTQEAFKEEECVMWAKQTWCASDNTR